MDRRVSYLPSTKRKSRAGASAKRDSRATADELFSFEALLAELSARFINLPAARVDGAITDALRQIVTLLNVDRSQLMRLWTGTGRCPRDVFVGVDGVPAVPPRAWTERFPWAIRRLRNGESMVVANLDELPPEAAADKASWKQMGVRSNLTMPLIVAGKLEGAIALGCLRRERTWSETLVLRFRVLAEVLANALAHKRAQEALDASIAFERLVSAVLAAFLIAKRGVPTPWRGGIGGSFFIGREQMMGNTRKAWLLAQSVALIFGAGAMVAPVAAQSLDDQWKFTAVIYGYFPKISGSSSFPTGTTVNFGVDPSSYLHNLNGAFMGALQAEKRSWVLFTDVVYTDIRGSKSGTRDFSLGNLPLPVGLTLDANLKVKSTLWTLAGGYRTVATPQWTLDLFGGARDLDLNQTLSYNLSADVGPIVGQLRQGSSNVSVNNWDAIVGAKGRVGLGDSGQWFLPYYADFGTGQSNYTYQGYAGLGYTFSWGELIGVWRYIDYKLNNNGGTTLKLNGPAVGVALHW